MLLRKKKISQNKKSYMRKNGPYLQQIEFVTSKLLEYGKIIHSTWSTETLFSIGKSIIAFDPLGKPPNYNSLLGCG
jgi:hypothetical protein